jgi:acetyltransferase-like isoleucine patch superfamily enzyme
MLQGARVGANATILPGITIGQDALVGAGSVVTHDVAERMVVIGVPARELRPVALEQQLEQQA